METEDTTRPKRSELYLILLTGIALTGIMSVAAFETDTRPESLSPLILGLGGLFGPVLGVGEIVAPIRRAMDRVFGVYLFLSLFFLFAIIWTDLWTSPEVLLIELGLGTGAGAVVGSIVSTAVVRST
ncbi:hypothetical protein [Natronorubrum halophilum]|uniref:hypothetical protein n=1 Tax=Natronorubrum halophilum TaxID=1702106 RepID=UPI0013CE76B0|nr:hypothetical protein [Natronorubrum halophilum]